MVQSTTNEHSWANDIHWELHTKCSWRGIFTRAWSGKVGLQQGVIYGWREPHFHGQLARGEKEGAEEGRKGLRVGGGITAANWRTEGGNFGRVVGTKQHRAISHSSPTSKVNLVQVVAMESIQMFWLFG